MKWLHAAIPTFLILASFAHAQTTPDGESPEANEPPSPEAPAPKDQKALIRYSGVVQFADGSIERVDASKARTQVAHGAAIYEDERLQLGESATLKIVTRQDCIAVLHGEGLALASNREKPWRLKAQAVRWICPEGKSETFVYQNLPYRITSGEVLLAGNKLIVLKGQLRTSKTPQGGFAARTSYTFAAGAYSRSEPQDEKTNRAFHLSRKPPKESVAWPEPPEEEKPPEPKLSRLVFGPVSSGGQIGYDVTPLGEENLSGMGGRLQFHRRLESGRSLLVALTIRDMMNEERREKSAPTPVGKVSNDLFVMLLEAGARTKHEAIVSTFYRFGAGLAQPKIFVNRQDIGYSSDDKYEFWVVSATGGLDAIYCPPVFDSIGVTAGIEAQLIQSLGRGARESLGTHMPTSYPEESREPWSLTLFSLNLMLGLVYQF